MEKPLESACLVLSFLTKNAMFYVYPKLNLKESHDFKHHLYAVNLYTSISSFQIAHFYLLQTFLPFGLFISCARGTHHPLSFGSPAISTSPLPKDHLIQKAS